MLKQSEGRGYKVTIDDARLSTTLGDAETLVEAQISKLKMLDTLVSFEEARTRR